MSEIADPRERRRAALLEAAYRRFARYGYRRTTIDDVAHEACVSRPSVYQHFRGKEQLFRALSERAHDAALAAASRAVAEDGPLPHRLRGALAAKLDMVLRLTDDPVHTAELLEVNARLCAPVTERFEKAYRALLADLFSSADGLDPAAGGIDLAGSGLTAADAAELAHAAAVGLSAEFTDIAESDRRLDQLVWLVVRGLGGHPTHRRIP